MAKPLSQLLEPSISFHQLPPTPVSSGLVPPTPPESWRLSRPIAYILPWSLVGFAGSIPGLKAVMEGMPFWWMKNENIHLKTKKHEWHLGTQQKNNLYKHHIGISRRSTLSEESHRPKTSVCWDPTWLFVLYWKNTCSIANEIYTYIWIKFEPFKYW